MGERRAQARLCGRDARAPGSQIAPASPVIPAKAGIQTIEAKPATQNQARIAANKSLPPLRGKARMGVSRASSPPLPGRQPAPASPVIPAKAGIRTVEAKFAARNQSGVRKLRFEEQARADRLSERRARNAGAAARARIGGDGTHIQNRTQSKEVE